MPAQRSVSELRVRVSDAAGQPVPDASIDVRGDATQVARKVVADSYGRVVVGALPVGAYLLEARFQGFQPTRQLVTLSSELPVAVELRLEVAPIQTSVVVSETGTLLNTARPGLVHFLGDETLRDRRGSLPSRAVLDLIDTQPGWLLEANGVLHPRGAEYDVQYVIDGIPIFDNRSPAFVPAFSVEDFQSLNVMTGGYAAEYGRKLGGVIEATTRRDRRPGLHGATGIQGGSFETLAGFANVQYGWRKAVLGLSGEGMRTNRYLDPPVERNFSNRGSGGGVGARLEFDPRAGDRLRFSARRKRVGFLVPNDLLQEAAGQRQDRTGEETMGQAAYQHVFSANALADVRVMGRDVSAGLWSNSLSTPIQPSQRRGFREAYLNGSVSLHRGRHDIKMGAEAIFASLNERFDYRITAYEVQGVEFFDDDTPERFAFAARAKSREQSAFVQDQIRFGNLIVNAGVRWDRYSLLVKESTWSPRLGVAWNIAPAGLILRASYDRVFQTPAIENILLSGSDAVLAVGEEGVRLPLKPARGNFFEAGFSKTLGRYVRLDAAAYRRNIRNFADDSVLLNTGISFPIAFERGEIYGYEAKIEVPRWGRFSGFASYANMMGRAKLPIAGGLFLEEDEAALINASGTFAVTQDQRNTVRSRWRYQLYPRLWLAAAGQYGSGLPVELEGGNDENLARLQYGQAVLDRVNMSRERVRPNFSVDLSAGADVLKRERLNVRVQTDVFNVGNRLNVINFAGLLSGTAIATTRNVSLRLHAEF